MFQKIKHITTPLGDGLELTDIIYTKLGKVLGKCSITNNNGTFQIFNLWVVPEQRGKGIGKSLLTYGEELCDKLGCKELHIQPETEDLLFWYSTLGYELITADDVLMKKTFNYG